MECPVFILAALDGFLIDAVCHDHAVQCRRISGVGDVCLDVERHVEQARDAVAHVQRRHERQDERTARSDSPRRESLTEIRFGRVDLEPRPRRVEETRDADRRVDEKTAELVPRPLEFGAEQAAERAGREFEIHAEIVELLNRGARQDRCVDPSERIDHVVHPEIRHREHRTVEPLDRVAPGEFKDQFARRPRRRRRRRLRPGGAPRDDEQSRERRDQAHREQFHSPAHPFAFPVVIAN